MTTPTTPGARGPLGGRGRPRARPRDRSRVRVRHRRGGHPPAGPLALALVLLVATAAPVAQAVAEDGLGVAAAFPCDDDQADLPCNLRMTFDPHDGNENYLAINPTDPDNFIGTAKDYGLTGEPGVQPCNALNVWTGFYTTTDGGRTWSNGYADGYAGGPDAPITGYRCSTDPIVAFDDEGTAYLSGLAYDSTGQTDAIWVAKSFDGGVTFEGMAIADEQNFDDKNWLAVDPVTKNVYVTWTKFSGDNGIWFRRALDGNLSDFDPRVKLSGASSGAAQGSFIAVAADGTVYVSWTDAVLGGTGNIYLVKSTDEGATWTSEEAVLGIVAADWSGGTPYRTPTLPQIAVDRSTGPHAGTLYAVWQDKRHGDPDVYLARSTDGGDTFEAPVRINDDAEGNGAGQNLPSVAVDPVTGRVHVVWYDRRDDADNQLLGTYYAVSKDGGQSFSPNQRLTTHLSEASPCKHQSGSVFIGDYLGVAAHNGTVRAAFVDTRNGRCDLYTALMFAAPEVTSSVPGHVEKQEPLTVPLEVVPYAGLDGGTLAIALPDHWTLLDAAGGTVDPGAPDDGEYTVAWTLGPTADDVTFPLRVLPTASAKVDLSARLDWDLTEGVARAGTAYWNETLLVSYPVLEASVDVPIRIPKRLPYNATFEVANTGLGDATNATVRLSFPDSSTPLAKGAGAATDPPAAGLTYGSPVRSDPTVHPDGQLTWSLGTVAPGDRVHVTVTFQGPLDDDAILYRFRAVFSGTAPDGLPVGDEASDFGVLRPPNLGDAEEAVGTVEDWLTAP